MIYAIRGTTMTLETEILCGVLLLVGGILIGRCIERCKSDKGGANK